MILKRISAVVATALLISASASAKIRVGAERSDRWLPYLEGKRVAVLANHTSLVDGVHLVDTLSRLGVNVVGIVSPEHGFRGTADAGEKVGNSVDEATGIPIWSLYNSWPRRLTDEQMRSFDIMIVDLQDVGLRFYTYYITMLDIVNACADYGHRVIILDRPNPNGMYVDGPLLDMRFRSGVGALPIPVVHGMTLGELALMAVGEGWVNRADVKVIPCSGYTHSMRYVLPVAPSPNLRSQHAVYLYPSTCLFEGTVCSLGRGTDFPFEVYGHPDMKECDFRFIPRSVPGAKNPPLKELVCRGVDLRQVPDEEIISKGFNLEYVIDAYRRMGIGERFFTPFFDKLVGTDYVRLMIVEGATADEIRARWRRDVEGFRELRHKYLLYQD